MNWDKDKVYVMRLLGQISSAEVIGMWWYEEEAPMKPGMWRTMRIGTGRNGDGIWYGKSNVSYGPGAFSQKDWQLLDNPSPVKWDRLADSEWIAKV